MLQWYSKLIINVLPCNPFLYLLYDLYSFLQEEQLTVLLLRLIIIITRVRFYQKPTDHYVLSLSFDKYLYLSSILNALLYTLVENLVGMTEQISN